MKYLQITQLIKTLCREKERKKKDDHTLQLVSQTANVATRVLVIAWQTKGIWATSRQNSPVHLLRQRERQSHWTAPKYSLDARAPFLLLVSLSASHMWRQSKVKSLEMQRQQRTGNVGKELNADGIVRNPGDNLERILLAWGISSVQPKT